MHWIPYTSIDIKPLRVQVSIPFIAKDIAIIRILVNRGGHLAFSHEKLTKKMETVIFQSFRVNLSEKSQLFKIYMKKSQNDTITSQSPQSPTVVARIACRMLRHRRVGSGCACCLQDVAPSTCWMWLRVLLAGCCAIDVLDVIVRVACRVLRHRRVGRVVIVRVACRMLRHRRVGCDCACCLQDVAPSTCWTSCDCACCL